MKYDANTVLVKSEPGAQEVQVTVGQNVTVTVRREDPRERGDVYVTVQTLDFKHTYTLGK